MAEVPPPPPHSVPLLGVELVRHIWAPLRPTTESRRKRVNSVDPFSPEYADLFLRFARWFDSQGMEKVEPGDLSTLDTERNAQAALAWVHDYGVLGLDRNPNSTFAVGGNLGRSSTQIAAELLGVPHLGHGGTRAYRMSAEGGKHETVEMFVLEAYEANVVLKLYEAASVRAVNVSAISRFMSDTLDDFQLHLLRKYGRTDKTEPGLCL